MTRVGLYFGLVQFLFVSCWTVYVIFLPGLMAQAGIDKRWTIWILMADQLVFAVMDFAIGVAADRVLATLRRIGPWLIGITVVSGGAFLLLPQLAPVSASALLAAVAVWAVTSSALRAPPLILLGRYVPAPGVPWVATLSLVGLGIAGAIAPYLTLSLRGSDPRLPFALASLALVAAVGGMVWAERRLVAAAPVEAPPPARPVDGRVIAFFAAVGLLGLGFQIHFALNSAPLYLRFAKPAELDQLMPVFWIGFNLLIFPACRANRRFGAVAVMTAGATLGALAAAAAGVAPTLSALVVLQVIAGGAWAAVLMSAMTAAIAIGHTGREGATTGGLFALLALATLARMAIVATQFNKDPALAALLPWLPGIAWAGAALLLAALALRPRAAMASP